MQIREFCDVQAKGRSLYVFINAIRNQPIQCENQYCKGEIFFCRVLKKDIPNLEKLAAQCHVTLTVTEISSLTGKLRKYRHRFGIPLGILISIALLFYYSNIITMIEIQGNTTIPESVILAQLEQNGIRTGAWIADLDTASCETDLRVNIPGISWAGIRNSGNHMIVQITEERPVPDLLHERLPCHIIARYDAQITNVRIYSGQLMHLLRDGVAKGEILVSGIIHAEDGKIYYRHALGNITGIYTQSITLTEPFQISQTDLTGKTIYQKWLQIFNLKIPLRLSKPDYAEFRTNEYYTPFCFLNHVLPCGILHKTTQELQSSVITRTEEEAKLALHTAIIRYEKNMLADVEIKDCQKSYHTDQNGITCDLIYTVEGEIGMPSEFFIPETEAETTKAEQ